MEAISAEMSEVSVGGALRSINCDESPSSSLFENHDGGILRDITGGRGFWIRTTTRVIILCRLHKQRGCSRVVYG